MPKIFCRFAVWPLSALVLLSITGCSSSREPKESSFTSIPLIKSIQPYKIDIIQGNVITREQLAVLRPGMPREQVRAILGTPLLASVFHGDRWDYAFTLRRQGELAQKRAVVVHFENNVLSRVDADEVPSEAEFAATLQTQTERPDKLPSLEASPEKLQKFKAASPAAGDAESGGTRIVNAPLPASYPPLEPAAAVPAAPSAP
jgi:outer membrane protein assembly factor BamE